MSDSKETWSVENETVRQYVASLEECTHCSRITPCEEGLQVWDNDSHGYIHTWICKECEQKQNDTSRT